MQATMQSQVVHGSSHGLEAVVPVGLVQSFLQLPHLHLPNPTAPEQCQIHMRVHIRLKNMCLSNHHACTMGVHSRALMSGASRTEERV